MTIGHPCRGCGRGPLVSKRSGIGGPLVHSGRGLCSPCYDWKWRRGQLAEHPARNRPWHETAAEGEQLYAEHPEWSWYDVAEAMDITHAALEKARQKVGRLPRATRREREEALAPRKPAHTPWFDLEDRGEL